MKDNLIVISERKSSRDTGQWIASYCWDAFLTVRLDQKTRGPIYLALFPANLRMTISRLQRRRNRYAKMYSIRWSV